MAITDQGTVLILGAGVSAPFSIPLGGEMIDHIADAITAERTKIYRKDDFGAHHARRTYLYSARDTDSYWQTPVHGALARRHLSPEGTDIDWSALQEDAERLKELRGLLHNQTSETIDDFIVENPQFSDLAKIAIAALMLRACYRLHDVNGLKHWGPSSFETRAIGPKGTRNWIHLLINVIRHGIRKGDVTQNNKVQIITFNYDRILEYVLEVQFSNTQARHPHYSTFIDIYHVHGCFEPLRNTNLDFPLMTLECAKGIHVVNEGEVSAAVEQARAKAKDMVLSAREIYAAGFSFAGPNCKMLGLEEWGRPIERSGRRYLRFCNFDGNVGVKRSAENLGKSAPKYVIVEEAAGSTDRPLSVEHWLKAGHLGELPG